MKLSKLKLAIQDEIACYQNDPDYDNPERQMEIFNDLKDFGYYHDYDVQCVNIASKTKSGEEVLKFILENRIPELEKTTVSEFTVLTKQDALEKMELVYIEMPSGFHIAIDASYVDQVGNFILDLPTGETLNTKLI